MLHLTVDAWRLQRLRSFPQLTSHTCNRPAALTQEAPGFKGRGTQNVDLSSEPIRACAQAVRGPVHITRTPLDPDELTLRLHWRMQCRALSVF